MDFTQVGSETNRNCIVLCQCQYLGNTELMIFIFCWITCWWGYKWDVL